MCYEKKPKEHLGILGFTSFHSILNAYLFFKQCFCFVRRNKQVYKLIFTLFQDTSFIAAVTSAHFPGRLIQFLQVNLWQPAFYVFPRKPVTDLSSPLLLPGN